MPPPKKKNLTKFTDTITKEIFLGVKWYQNIPIRLSGFRLADIFSNNGRITIMTKLHMVLDRHPRAFYSTQRDTNIWPQEV